MTREQLTEISDIVINEHAQDVGRFMKDCPSNSPLGLALLKYMGAQYDFMRDLRLWIDEGIVPTDG